MGISLGLIGFIVVIAAYLTALAYFVEIFTNDSL